MSIPANWPTSFVVRQNTALYMLANAVVGSQAEIAVASRLRDDLLAAEPGDLDYDAAARAMDVLSAATGVRQDSSPGSAG